jgi:hypothetical protein
MASLRRRIFLKSSAGLIICLGISKMQTVSFAAGGKFLSQVAIKSKRPPGAPLYSDVCFSSRFKRPLNANDPHDSLQAAIAFSATRFEWVYTQDKEFISKVKKNGCNFFQGTLAPNIGDWQDGKTLKGRVVDLSGNFVASPHMRAWKNSAWGCVNHPDFRKTYLWHCEKMLAAGVDGFQMDDPRLNAVVFYWGGCFCDYCMAGFREYLREKVSSKQRVDIGIKDITTFDFRTYLRAINAPSGDAFAFWEGVATREDKLRLRAIKKLFLEFQIASVSPFYKDIRLAINKIAERKVPFSSNNYNGNWGYPYNLFDYGVSELPEAEVSPEKIYTIISEAKKLDKAQVFTLVSESLELNRLVIATSYASGGHMIAPWDIYIKPTPEGSVRYFGKPEDYIDLYRFVRENKQLFEQYEDAAFYLPQSSDQRYTRWQPVSIVGGNNICAFTRAIPNNLKAPIAIHLIDWSTKPNSFTINLRKEFFFGSRLKFKFLKPGQPEETLETVKPNDSKLIRLKISELKPWGLLVVTGS